MTEEEAVILWPKVIAFHKENEREPSLTSSDQFETRLAQCLVYIKRKKMERLQKAGSAAASPLDGIERVNSFFDFQKRNNGNSPHWTIYSIPRTNWVC